MSSNSETVKESRKGKRVSKDYRENGGNVGRETKHWDVLLLRSLWLQRGDL